MNGVCWAGHLGLFVIVTSAGPTASARVLTSPDGINWTARSLPTTGVALNSVCWSSDLGLLVAVGDNNAVYTSPDAINWTKANGPATAKNWRFIVWAAGDSQKFCMIAGNASGNNDYAYCSDPASAAWSQKSLTGSAYDWQSIAYSPGLGATALRLAADFADEAVLTARATPLVAIALSVVFTDDAELAAPVTIGFGPHAPPIQVVVVLSW